MKFDITLNTADLRAVPKLAAEAEALGVDGVWTTETAHNPFLPATHAIAATTRLEVGTGIALAFPRSPMVTAQIAWDLAAQSDGRFILGLGTQVKAHITRRFSTAWDSPGPRLRDYILSMRAIWANWQNNKPLRYKGEFYEFTLMTPFFAPSPIAKPDIPIYIAGVNPYLCKLAGELCQGFHVHPFHTRRYLTEVILPNIEQGATEANRTRADVQTSCAIFVATGANPAEIENNSNAMKAQIAFYASTPSYEAVMALHGWGALAEQLNAMSRQNRWLEMATLISDEMLHEFAVVAPYDELPSRVRERYNGLLDRIGYYFPFESGLNAQQSAFWQASVATLSDSVVIRP
jgi:probable F420-dependent oxidoreductase